MPKSFVARQLGQSLLISDRLLEAKHQAAITPGRYGKTLSVTLSVSGVYGIQ